MNNCSHGRAITDNGVTSCCSCGEILSWINPFTKEIVGEYLILYTTKEGGEFKVLGGGKEYVKKVFKEAKKNGYIQIKVRDSEPPKRKLAFIALVRVKDNWDFVIEKINKEKGLNG